MTSIPRPLLKKCNSEILADCTSASDDQLRLQESQVALEHASTLDPHSVLWDWPFNEHGYARCSITQDTFSVQLDFSYLKNMKSYLDVKQCDRLHENHHSWQVGLCPTAAGADGTLPSENGFWRLEMQVLVSLNMLVIEAFRQVGTSLVDGLSCRNMKKLRRVFKVPVQYDARTLTTAVTKEGAFRLTALKRKQDDPIGPNRLSSVQGRGKLLRTDTVA